MNVFLSPSDHFRREKSRGLGGLSLNWCDWCVWQAAMTISNSFPFGEQLICEAEENPFADFMWMENEEEFDRQVILLRTYNWKYISIFIMSYVMFRWRRSCGSRSSSSPVLMRCWRRSSGSGSFPPETCLCWARTTASPTAHRQRCTTATCGPRTSWWETFIFSLWSIYI